MFSPFQLILEFVFQFQSEGQFPPKCIESSKSCTIHRLSADGGESGGDDGVVVVRNTAHVFPEQLHSWHRQLFSRLDFRPETVDVVLLTAANAVNYLEGPASASQTKEPPFMRSLFTHAAARALDQKQQQQQHPPLLETPNIVDGVAAQVMTACQVGGLRGAAFVVYAPARLEAATIEAFAPLTRPGGVLHGLAKPNPALAKTVKDGILKRDIGSLLYT